MKDSFKKIFFLFVSLLFLISTAAVSCSSPLGESTETDPSNPKTELTENASEPKETVASAPDPSQDDVLNILMIGNSFCYYYPDELYGLAKAAGIKMRICNVYYSGCTLEEHWKWWRLNQKNYKFYTYDENGRKEQKNMGLPDCLSQGNWDVISFQDASGTYRNGGYANAINSTEPYLTQLLAYVNSQFPLAQKYWHQTWAYQIGYDKNGFSVENQEKQNEMWEGMHRVALTVCSKHSLLRMPSGDAWQHARSDSRVGDILCKTDLYHDGESGGQYLNACVWFEVLTKKSCVGNPFSPDSYHLDNTIRQGLQEAAHRAVTETYGENYYIQ